MAIASDNPVGRKIWTLKSIAWLMVQIWFGNISLSFAQAASFHPIFGPILMTIFAALSSTLLLTSTYKYMIFFGIPDPLFNRHRFQY